MISRGDTMGVFQLSGEGMTKWIKELKPNRVEDLMAMVALYRPGPMAIIPDYIARKNDPSKISYFDPKMEKHLKASYGLLVYQDDCLYTAIELAGYNWVEVDKFRKAIGKKIPEEMAIQKEKFLNGCIANGYTKQKADEIFSYIEPFTSYGFNKAHAASYGMLAYRTAYMKANFPVEYMCALLTAESGDIEKVTDGVEECRHLGIIVSPPDINLSRNGFEIEKNDQSLDGNDIRFGFWCSQKCW
jgi:DNA polymerase-3 subunit alpha